ncbi:MAG: SAV_2336 N-terminal domain-related protein, partial [Chloroflexota bacterium]
MTPAQNDQPVINSVLSFDPREIADAIWLAAIRRTAVQTESSSTLSTDNNPPDSDHDNREDDYHDQEKPEHVVRPESTGEGKDKVDEGESDNTLNVHDEAPKADQSEDDDKGRVNESSQLPLAVSAASALPNQLPLSRSIRPLKRPINSRMRYVLDERRTAETTAAFALHAIQRKRKLKKLPIHLKLQPEKERWLDLHLIIDITPTMDMWHRSAVEFYQLLEQSGVFRQVISYRLEQDLEHGIATPAAARLRLGLAPQGRVCQGNELRSVSGRQVVLIISDCSGDIWHSGGVRQLIESWVQITPTAIAQPLPDTLWRSTALAHSDYFYTHATQPISQNKKLKMVTPPYWRKSSSPNGTPIPTFSLTAGNLLQWSKMILGQETMLFTSYYLPQDNESNRQRLANRQQRLKHEAETMGGNERWQRFQSLASPMARQLVRYLTALGDSVSLPAIFLVREAMLPEATQTHVAEVLRSDLFLPNHWLKEDEKQEKEEGLFFTFHPEVKEFLTERSYSADKRKVTKALTGHLIQINGRWSKLQGWLDVPESLTEDEINEAAKLFNNLLKSKNLGGVLQSFPVENLPAFGPAHKRLAELLKEQGGAGSKPVPPDPEPDNTPNTPTDDVGTLESTDQDPKPNTTPAPERAPYEYAITRIFSINNQVMGGGVAISDNQVLTCGHVVAAACGKSSDQAKELTLAFFEDLQITIDFPALESERLKAKVVFYINDADNE